LGGTNPFFKTGAAVGPFSAEFLFDIGGNYQVPFLVCAATSILGLMLTLPLTPLKAEPLNKYLSYMDPLPDIRGV